MANKVVCAWCGTVMQEGDCPVSHGCCQDCYNDMMPKPKEEKKDGSEHVAR